MPKDPQPTSFQAWWNEYSKDMPDNVCHFIKEMMHDAFDAGTRLKVHRLKERKEREPLFTQ